MTPNSPLTIAYQDEYLVAIDKPAGLLVHRSRIAAEAREFAVQKLRDQIGQQVFPVHRLDRPTSGVLLFGLNPEMAKRLTQQFESRSVQKQYVALVRGTPKASGVWDEPLLEKPDRIVDRLADENKPPQPAITRFETDRSWEVPFSTGKYPHSRYALVRIQPMTGRRHQIRRHFNHMGHPIVGDTSHGDRRHNRLFREQFDSHRLMLVAVSLAITHPVLGSILRIEADLGEDFKLTLDNLEAHKIEDPNDRQGLELHPGVKEVT